MTSQNSSISRRFIVAAICVAATLAATTARGAVSITGLVDTPTNLSFDFSSPGPSYFDFLIGDPQIASLTNWERGQETHVANLGGFGFGMELRHVGGPTVLLGHLMGVTPYGTALTDFETVAHGSDFDSYSLTITFNANGGYSGSISAVHGAGSVPDTGLSAVLLGSALLGVAACRRKVSASDLM